MVYDYLKQVAGFFSLITGELVFAANVGDTGRFIQFGRRLFFIQTYISEVTLGKTGDLENCYHLMEQAGWERNRSAWITYQKLTRFVFCHSKAVQVSKTAANTTTYFAQTQRRVPSVAPCGTYKKLFRVVQQQILDERIPESLDTYNLQAIICAIPCSDNEIIAESSGVTFSFRLVLQQLRDCVHSLKKYFFMLGQSEHSMPSNHVI